MINFRLVVATSVLGSAFGTNVAAYVLLQDPTLRGVSIKWGVTNIPYYINPSGSGLDIDQLAPLIQAAFAAWSPALNNHVTFTYMGTTTAKGNSNDRQNTIFWDTDKTFVPKSALAVTKPIWDS